MLSNTKSNNVPNVPNTRASRRNGTFAYGRKVVNNMSEPPKNPKNPKQKQYKKDIKIYQVDIVSQYGNRNCISVWETSDDKMNQHFGKADNNYQNYFSFTDNRGKTIYNVDLRSGWKYRRTLRWNKNKITEDGTKGDWQDLKSWYAEKNSDGTEENTEEIVEMEASFDLEDKNMFPKLSTKLNP